MIIRDKFCYTSGIYAEGYIVLAFLFVCSFIRSLLSVTFVEFTSKFLVKVVHICHIVIFM